MTANRLYDLGYTEIGDVDLLFKIIRTLNAILVDVRISPRSRNPEWRSHNLALALGDKYVHIPELGNINYKGGPITLKDIDNGLLQLSAFIRHSSVIVMCACSNRTKCHRLRIVSEFQIRFGITSTPIFSEQFQSFN